MPRREDNDTLTPNQVAIMDTMLDLKARLGRWPKQTEIRLVLQKDQAEISNALKRLEQRGLVTPTELVPNKLTDEGRKLLRRAGR